MNLLRRLVLGGFFALLSLCLTAVIVMGCLYVYIEMKLPSIEVLNNPQLTVPLQIYTRDGQLIAEYGANRSAPISLDQVPKQLIEAVLATEDNRYFEHPGVDIVGLFRAIKSLVLTGKKTQVASTITMQVARKFFLTPEKTYSRKFNEILLALKIDHELSKEKVLELYLNKIYFGQRAYGVAAAAEVYYGKSLNQLTLPELAMIAGLPQSPSRNNPINNPENALKRRDHVFKRMLECGYITEATYEKAIQAPLTAHFHGTKSSVYAPYVAEMVRAMMIEQYGDKTYTDGFKVYTTVDSHLQKLANSALDNGLLAYDQRHGYRGPVAHLGQSVANDLSQALIILHKTPSFNHIQPGIVLSLNPKTATVLLGTNQQIIIPWQGLSWAGKNPYDILQIGDLIYVQHLCQQWRLAQVPKVQSAIVALNPNNGAIVALDGGFTFD